MKLFRHFHQAVKVYGRVKVCEWIRQQMEYVRDNYSRHVLHDCCEGLVCCACGVDLDSGAWEPVGLGLPRFHRLCNKCLWLAGSEEAWLDPKDR